MLKTRNAPGRESDHGPRDRNAVGAAVGAQRGRQLEAADTGQGDVRDHHVGPVGQGDRQRLAGIRDANRIEPRCRQKLDVAAERVLVIFDDEDPIGDGHRLTAQAKQTERQQRGASMPQFRVLRLVEAPKSECRRSDLSVGTSRRMVCRAFVAWGSSTEPFAAARLRTDASTARVPAFSSRQEQSLERSYRALVATRSTAALGPVGAALSY